MEREFQTSLSHLCCYYQIPEPDASALPFPQNLYRQWRETAQMLKAKDKGLICMVTRSSAHQAVLVTAETLNIGCNVFYVPVRPLWHWLHCAQRQRTAEVLISIFAYLCQVAKVPFYGKDYTYMDGQYETLREWTADNAADDDPEDAETIAWRAAQERTLYDLQRAGGYFLRFFFDPVRLQHLETVCTTLHPVDALDKDILSLAVQFLQLYRDYPKASIFDHTGEGLLYPDDEHRITPDQYTQIFWSCRDAFADELNDMINNEFNEIAYTDEPVVIHHFGQYPSDEQQTDLSFEKKFYPLLEDLRDLLNNHDIEPENVDY